MSLTNQNLNFPIYFQQHIHGQQIPGTPPQPIPGLGALAGPLGAFAGPMGIPHTPQGLLKAPQDLHREDIKVPLGPGPADERLVRPSAGANSNQQSPNVEFGKFQRNSVSPADQKYRPRSPLEPIEPDTKRRKDEKLTHVSISMVYNEISKK